MRKSFDGLMAIIRDTYQLVPYASTVYLFCGNNSRKIKVHFDKDVFVLLQKKLNGSGQFQWSVMHPKHDFLFVRNFAG